MPAQFPGFLVFPTASRIPILSDPIGLAWRCYFHNSIYLIHFQIKSCFFYHRIPNLKSGSATQRFSRMFFIVQNLQSRYFQSRYLQSQYLQSLYIPQSGIIVVVDYDANVIIAVTDAAFCFDIVITIAFIVLPLLLFVGAAVAVNVLLLLLVFLLWMILCYCVMFLTYLWYISALVLKGKFCLNNLI